MRFALVCAFGFALDSKADSRSAREILEFGMLATRVLKIDRERPDDSPLEEAARILRDGGLVAFATETVYGLGADATNPEAISRIFEAKGRPSNNPLIVHAADLEMAKSCAAEWSEIADELAQRFWPGPLTLVMPRSAIIPDLVTAGLTTVGIRIPALRSTRELIAKVGRPLAAPSANRSNQLSPTTAAHVLKDMEGRIELILDAGSTKVGLESTVLDLSSEKIRVLRPGPVSARELRRALAGIQVIENGEGPAPVQASPRSPGQLDVHYAPRTPSIRVEPHLLEGFEIVGPTALLTFANFQPPVTAQFQRTASFRSPEEAAENLYRLLHEWDDEGFSRIVVVLPPDLAEWRAVRDRLIRATTPL